MSSTPIKLVVGLGNPGEQYLKTRHNAGFLFVETLCAKLGLSLKSDKQCFGRTAQGQLSGNPIRLLMPDTFMNLSGKAVVTMLSYYKINIDEMLVVHDDLDLDAGIARLKVSGGHGDNNGLRDIIAKTGSKDFVRLRLGIGHPGIGRDVSAYVLKAPNKDQQQKIDNAIDDALMIMPDVMNGELQKAMNYLHTQKE